MDYYYKMNFKDKNDAVGSIEKKEDGTYQAIAGNYGKTYKRLAWALNFMNAHRFFRDTIGWAIAVEYTNGSRKIEQHGLDYNGAWKVFTAQYFYRKDGYEDVNIMTQEDAEKWVQDAVLRPIRIIDPISEVKPMIGYDEQIIFSFLEFIETDFKRFLFFDKRRIKNTESIKSAVRYTEEVLEMLRFVHGEASPKPKATEKMAV